MARQETDKEDLLREATALVERVELATVSHPHGSHITAGFRLDGAASIFVGADPVYQFNAAGELRRAYCQDLLYKAMHGRLIHLRRVRTQDEVQLLRHELTEAEQNTFMTKMKDALADLAAALTRGECKIIGQVPKDADIIGRLQEWLTRQRFIKIAATPHATQRRP
jgi:hypothetical protein